MNSILDTVAGHGLDVVIKATALMGVAGLVHAALGRRQVLARAAFGNALLLGLLLMPVACLATPRVRLTLGPAVPLAMGSGTWRPPASPLAPGPAPIPALGDPETKTPPPTPGAEEAAPDPIAPALPPSPRTVGAVASRRRPVLAPESPPARPWGREYVLEALIPAYLAILVILLIRLARSLAGVRRLVETSDPVEEPRWCSALERWRTVLGIGRQVALARTPRVSVPAVVGWRRPTILLPIRMNEQTDPGVIDAVVLHELCHVRRGDYPWNLALRVAGALYWPHPLMWAWSRIVGDVREQACDELCLGRLAGGTNYREVLIGVASRLVSPPAPSPSLLMARSSRLGRRLASLEGSRGLSRCLSSRRSRGTIAAVVIAASGLIGAVEFAAAGAPPSRAKDDEPKAKAVVADDPEPKPADAETFEFLALDDESGEPLPGVILRIYLDYEYQYRTTGPDGRAIVPCPKSEYSFTVDSWKEGYVQERKTWSDLDSSRKPIPRRYEYRFRKGVGRIGGRVIDEEGKPIAGATLHLYESPPYRKVWKGMVGNLPVETDADGRWTTASVPPETCPIHARVEHPEFRTGNLDVPLTALFAGKGDLTMQRGAIVEGVVLDEAGDPIDGAEVLVASYSYNPDAPRAATGGDGRFRLADLDPGETSLIVKAPGRKPEQSRVVAGPEPSRLEFRLGPGRVLRGRVVDTDGEAIADAQLYASYWRRLQGLAWHATTDGEGRFTWDSAPDDAVHISAQRSGYLASDREVAANEAEEVWTLRRSISIHGAVTDARTGAKIPLFRVTPLQNLAGPEIAMGRISDTHWWGRYNVDWQEPPDGLTFTIEAQGYRSFTSRGFARAEKNVVYDAKLEKLAPGEGGGPTGTVIGLDGKPLAGADVLMGTTSQGGLLEDGQAHPPEGHLWSTGAGYVTTGEDGSFTFHPVAESFHLAIVHESGYTQVSGEELAANSRVAVRPWGRIEGRVDPSLARLPDTRLEAETDRPYLLPSEGIEARYQLIPIDPEGKFVIERVPPGPMSVALTRYGSNHYQSIGRAVHVLVREDETARAALGGSGRTVVGRVVVPEDEGMALKDLAFETGHTFDFATAKPVIPFPPALAVRGGKDERDAWSRRWWEGDEARAYRKAFDNRAVGFASDGSFRLEDVAPGEYTLSPMLRDPFSKDRQTAAMTARRVVVPEGPPGTVVDLGEVPVRKLHPLKAGHLAPPVVGRTLDGRPFFLGDLRGKTVVLHFWSSDDVQNLMNSLRSVADLAKAHAGDADLAIVGLNLDHDPEDARRVVAAADLSWPQVALGDWDATTIPAAYDVAGSKPIVVVGPDGKVVTYRPWGAWLEQDVATARAARKRED